MAQRVHGSCLCGEAAWEADGPLDLISHCHCSICRKFHGAAFVTVGAAHEASFRWLRGRARARAWQSSPGFQRLFCGRCGSPLPADDSEPVFVPVGALDDDPGARPLAHIFVASKAPWFEICDELPRFDAYPPGFESPVVADRERGPAPPGRLRGSCLCDAVGFEVEPPLEGFRHCHCGRCRKARSALFASNFAIPLPRFAWTRGEASLESFPLPGARYFMNCFCRECGAKLPRVDPARGLAVVPASSLDDAPAERPARHIFAASKAPWYEIPGALPRHDEYPPEAP